MKTFVTSVNVSTDQTVPQGPITGMLRRYPILGRMIAYDPEIMGLLERAGAEKDDGSEEGYCQTARFFSYGRFSHLPSYKRQIPSLAGYHRRLHLYERAGLIPTREGGAKDENGCPRFWTMAELSEEFKSDSEVMAANPIYEPKFLSSEEAYDSLYQAVFDLLPACRGDCGCLVNYWDQDEEA